MPSKRNDRVIALLKNLGIDVMEASTRTGKQPATLYRIVNDEHEASKSTLRAIADGLGASYDWLLTGKGEMMSGAPVLNLQRGGDRPDPYRDALVIRLQEEAQYLREMLKLALGGKAAPQAANQGFQTAEQTPDARIIALHTLIPATVQPTGTDK